MDWWHKNPSHLCTNEVEDSEKQQGKEQFLHLQQDTCEFCAVSFIALILGLV